LQAISPSAAKEDASGAVHAAAQLRFWRRTGGSEMVRRGEEAKGAAAEGRGDWQ